MSDLYRVIRAVTETLERELVPEGGFRRPPPPPTPDRPLAPEYDGRDVAPQTEEVEMPDDEKRTELPAWLEKRAAIYLALSAKGLGLNEIRFLFSDDAKGD